ncbi:xanthine dehydrogenase family protein molybdopterin-binding subunit [Comamonas sp. C11]|uniref:xanthine dehydrogenase family protein molybdopterin-binding subunit n=1 Tax=Comamonas sp. C11 TaxID=2966554 RepID=UPI002111D672|nr:xanthine dehydrogenase family protein molybdopterin-binding subunit [Comamonas sp. C11]UUC95844.1 xanthine dehydrogenase family protein molybdopterin-binding subunit [Comamonas sp. C11]
MPIPNHFLADMPKGLRALAADTIDAGTKLERRDFLKLATASGFALGVFPSAALARAKGNEQVSANVLKPTQQPSAFVKIDRDGTVTVTINRLEFGQGVQTGLPMVLAEELDADWSKMNSVHGNADPAYMDPVMGMHLTGGSTAIKNSYVQYRELGARTRSMLLATAAKRWGVDPQSLRTQTGQVIGPRGKRLGYGELADEAMKMPVPQQVKLKDVKDFRIIGHATGRLDARTKSSGKQSYGIDMHLPGMLTALVAHPPVYGSRIQSVDDSATKAIKGVREVLRVPSVWGGELVAVLADGYWPAKQGRDALKIQWDSAAVGKVDSARQLAQYRDLAKKPGALKFDADVSAMNGAVHKISAEYVFPYLAHTPMEPLNCTVRVTGAGKDAKAELWLGTQAPGWEVATAARVLGVAPQNVRVNVQMAGGGFGRRANPRSDYVAEACEIAKAARASGIDAPVRMIWSREDDVKGGYYRPMHVHRAEIGFDGKGKVIAWDHVIVGQSLAKGTAFEGFMVKNGVDTTTVEGMKEPYDLPMRLSVHHPELNAPVLWWRSVGSTHTAYVMETLMDEIARAVKQDPVAYRLQQFGDRHPRHKAALQLAVEKSGYGKRQLAEGRAWGVAVHQSFDSVVAYVVEASMKDGTPKLHAVTAGVHCNLAVNPRSVEAQVQGGALMGLGMCLPGAAITFKDGQVEQGNFNDYTVARLTDMPAITVHIVPSADAPTGMGEPGVPPLAPAFANAIAKLSGHTPRELPFPKA